MIWKRFSDQLAVLFIVLFVGLWVADPFLKFYFKFGLPESVLGATVVIVTLVAQFYFRRKEPTENGGTQPPISP